MRIGKVRFEPQRGKQAIGSEPEARAQIRLAGKKGIAPQLHSARFPLAIIQTHRNAPAPCRKRGRFKKKAVFLT